MHKKKRFSNVRLLSSRCVFSGNFLHESSSIKLDNIAMSVGNRNYMDIAELKKKMFYVEYMKHMQ